MYTFVLVTIVFNYEWIFVLEKQESSFQLKFEKKSKNLIGSLELFILLNVATRKKARLLFRSLKFQGTRKEELWKSIAV